jgi:hypothetical protein
VDAFLAERAGYERELAGPFAGLDDAASARRALERFARVVIESGPGAGAALVADLEASLGVLDKVELLAFSGVKIETPDLKKGTAVSVSLATTLQAAPLVAPPGELVPGASARCVLVVLPGEDPRGAALEAWAWSASGAPLTGRCDLPVAAARSSGGAVEGGALALREGHALTLVGPRGPRVRPGERLVARLRPPRVARLSLVSPSREEEWGAWTAEGGIVAPTAAWRPGAWTAIVRDQNGVALADAPFEVEKGPGLVVEDAAGTRLAYAKLGDSVFVRLLEGGADLPSGKAALALEHESGGIAWGGEVESPRAEVPLPASCATSR